MGQISHKFIKLADKIKSQCTEEEFQRFINSKGTDSPALKLSDEDMRLLKGGAFFIYPHMYTA